MSATYEPCPRCGVMTMCDLYEPSLCSQCRRDGSAVKRAIRIATASELASASGNRKARRAAAKKGRKR